MKRVRRRTAWIIVSTAGLASFAPIQGGVWGATQYWDTNGATAGAGATPNGTWDATTPLWSVDPSGASATDVWASGNSAVFSAGSDAAGTYTVTLSGSQSASDVFFEEGLTRLTGGNLILTTGAVSSTGNDFTVRADIQSVIEGTAGFIKNGTGLVMLSAANTYTGGTTINGGGINLGASNVLPDATVLMINSTGRLNMGAFNETVAELALNGGVLSGTGVLTAGSYSVNAGTIAAGLGGTGALTKSGAGSVTLGGVNSYSGGTVVGAGTLVCQQPGVLPSGGDVTINGGSLNIMVPQTCGMFTLGSGALQGSGSLTPSAIELRKGSILGNLAGSAPVVKTTSDNVFLGSANSYISDTTVLDGILTIANGNALGATGAASGTTVAAGATVRLSDPLTTTSEHFTINGAGFNGQGAIDSSTFSAVTLAGPITLGSDATIHNSFGSGSLFISGGINTAGHTLTFGGPDFGNCRITTNGISGSGGVTLGNFATVRLFTPCTYTGATTINGGNLFVFAANALPDTANVTVNGGNLGLSAADTIAGATLISGTISSPLATPFTLTISGALEVQSGSVTAPIAGTATVTKTTAATVEMSAGGPSTYSGATFVNAGTLRFNNGLPTPGDAITVSPVGTLGGGGTIAREVINNGTVAGPTTPGVFLTLGGLVSGGGVFTGNITIADKLSPGSSPAAIVMDNVMFDGTAELMLEIGGLVPGADYDVITFATGATLGGTLDVQLINGFEPAAGDAFDVLNGPTYGSFGSIVLPALGPHQAWDVSMLYTTGTLAVIVPEPAAAGGFIGAVLLGQIGRRGGRRQQLWFR